MTALLWGLVVLAALAWVSIEVMRWDLGRKGAAQAAPMARSLAVVVAAGVVGAGAALVAMRRGASAASPLAALGLLVALTAAAVGRRPVT